MLRKVAAATGVLTVAVAMPLAPTASADDGTMVLTEGGKVRCLVSADNVPQGGGPMVVCEQADGQPFGLSPWAATKFSQRLNLAVKRGTGEFYWAKVPILGTGPGTGNVTLSEGQTYHINGWTIEPEQSRTKFTNDGTGKGMYLGVVTLRQF
jgi:Ca-activated chloride channel family protein